MSQMSTRMEAPLARHVRDVVRRPAHTGKVNVGETERMVSLVGGGSLMLYGINRGTLPGMALAVLGGALVYRGATGHCGWYQALGISTAPSGGPEF